MADGYYLTNQNTNLQMALSTERIQEEISKPSKATMISKAIEHQNRLKFHCETSLRPGSSQAEVNFKSYVYNLIPESKRETFDALFRYPIKTNEVTDVCFDKLSRIFDGRNPAFNYQFSSTEEKDDWEYYRQEVLGEPAIWQTQAFEYFKTEINSILVVDLPSEQRSERPDAYFYFLTIDNVKSFDSLPDSTINWIIFSQDNGNIAVIDDERYRIFATDKSGNIAQLLIDKPHDLGYCPCRFFWSQFVSREYYDVKKSPLTKELSTLDDYLFKITSKQHLDLYAAYPIYSGYASDCDYQDADNNTCDGGFLKDSRGNYKLDPYGAICKCPKCANKRLAGPGSYVEIPAPTEERPHDLRNPIQVLTIDEASLNYNVQECARLRNAIITAVVGNNEEVQQKDAINEQQVKANYESLTSVLLRVKKGFEEAQQFVDTTICKLRYGTKFISARVNYGTEFYIYDVAQLRENYKVAKDSGASESELDALQKQIIETEYRHNPIELQRQLILAELEPYRHLSHDELQTFYQNGNISAKDLQIKLNFANFVARFERENTNVITFGEQIPFSKKIDAIKQRFEDYINEVPNVEITNQ